MIQDKSNGPSGLELDIWYKVGFSTVKYQQSSAITHMVPGDQ